MQFCRQINYLYSANKPAVSTLLCMTFSMFDQARSQKFAMVGSFGGLGAEPPATEGQWGSGAAAGGWGSGGKALSRRRHEGLEAEPPALKILRVFAKITKFYSYFDKK